MPNVSTFAIVNIFVLVFLCMGGFLLKSATGFKNDSKRKH